MNSVITITRIIIFDQTRIIITIIIVLSNYLLPYSRHMVL